MIVGNCEVLEVGAVSFHSRRLEFCEKTIGYHTKYLSNGMDIFKCFQKVFRGIGDYTGSCISCGNRLISMILL